MFAETSSMPWLQSPNITITHGFSTRTGGVSPAPFSSLNLGGTEDDPAHIEENRKRALAELGLSIQQVARLKQVHGNTVCLAKPGVQTGDTLVSKEKGIVLTIGAADCYPLLFHDPVNNIIGAAHAGWRGTLARIAKHTVEAMLSLGAEIKNIRVAIGQGICREKYEVSDEVIKQFSDAGFPATIATGRKLDLLAANQFVLKESGILSENTWSLNRCTTEPDFFSYRRDKGITGRMWAVIGM